MVKQGDEDVVAGIAGSGKQPTGIRSPSVDVCDPADFPEFPGREGSLLRPQPPLPGPGLLLDLEIIRPFRKSPDRAVRPDPTAGKHFEIDVPVVQKDDGDYPIMTRLSDRFESYLLVEHLVGQRHESPSGKRLAMFQV